MKSCSCCCPTVCDTSLCLLGRSTRCLLLSLQMCLGTLTIRTCAMLSPMVRRKTESKERSFSWGDALTYFMMLSCTSIQDVKPRGHWKRTNKIIENRLKLFNGPIFIKYQNTNFVRVFPPSFFFPVSGLKWNFLDELVLLLFIDKPNVHQMVHWALQSYLTSCLLSISSMY